MFKRLDAVAKPGAILASNTSTLDVNKIAAFTKRPAGRGRHALLQPGQRDEAARSRARREDREGRARHRHAAREEDQEDRGGFGRVRRLHRQPHDRAVHPASALHARRRRAAGAGRSRDREVRLCDGTVPHERSRGQRHRLGDPQAPLSGAAGPALFDASPTGCARPAASVRRPAPAGTTTSRANAMRSLRNSSTR